MNFNCSDPECASNNPFTKELCDDCCRQTDDLIKCMAYDDKTELYYTLLENLENEEFLNKVLVHTRVDKDTYYSMLHEMFNTYLLEDNNE